MFKCYCSCGNIKIIPANVMTSFHWINYIILLTVWLHRCIYEHANHQSDSLHFNYSCLLKTNSTQEAIPLINTKQTLAWSSLVLKGKITGKDALSYFCLHFTGSYISQWSLYWQLSACSVTVKEAFHVMCFLSHWFSARVKSTIHFVEKTGV